MSAEFYDDEERDDSEYCDCGAIRTIEEFGLRALCLLRQKN